MDGYNWEVLASPANLPVRNDCEGSQQLFYSKDLRSESTKHRLCPQQSHMCIDSGPNFYTIRTEAVHPPKCLDTFDSKHSLLELGIECCHRRLCTETNSLDYFHHNSCVTKEFGLTCDSLGSASEIIQTPLKVGKPVPL